MWRNLPFFLLWILGCLQRLCPSQGSWSSREKSHALCWVWWPRYKRRVGVHADPSGHFSHSPLLLWVKGNQSWSPAPPKKVQGRSSGKSSGMWWNWEEAQWGWKWWLEGDVQPVGFLDLTSAGTQGEPLDPASHWPCAEWAQPPDQKLCIKYSFIPQQVKVFRECLSLIFHPN